MTILLVDTRLTWPIAFILILSCIFPVIEAFNLLSNVEISVRSIENIQAVLLLSFAFFTFVFMRPFQLQNGQKTILALGCMLVVVTVWSQYQLGA